MSEHCESRTPLVVDDRQLATILAALCFPQAENLQGDSCIADRAIEEIATDGGRLIALDFDEVESPRHMLNTTAEPP